MAQVVEEHANRLEDRSRSPLQGRVAATVPFANNMGEFMHAYFNVNSPEDADLDSTGSKSSGSMR